MKNHRVTPVLWHAEDGLENLFARDSICFSMLIAFSFVLFQIPYKSIISSPWDQIIYKKHIFFDAFIGFISGWIIFSLLKLVFLIFKVKWKNTFKIYLLIYIFLFFTFLSIQHLNDRRAQNTSQNIQFNSSLKLMKLALINRFSQPIPLETLKIISNNYMAYFNQRIIKDLTLLGNTIENNKILDPWGNEVKFTLINNELEIRSAGPDCVFDTEDDLFSIIK